MTTRKPVTEPAVPPDTEFGNFLTSRHDQAVSERQRLEGQKKTREEFYAREKARLEAAEAQEMASINTQIGQHQNVINMARAALDVDNLDLGNGLRLVAS